MSSDEAYKILGVSSGASFDQILAAKNSILAGCKGDQDKMMEVRFARAPRSLPARARADPTARPPAGGGGVRHDLHAEHEAEARWRGAGVAHRALCGRPDAEEGLLAGAQRRTCVARSPPQRAAPPAAPETGHR
jgi:hypothetical protein